MARGEGLRVRLAPIEGVTPKAALSTKLYFPAVTGDFEFSEAAAHTDYRTVAAGEFSMPSGGSKARDLRRFSIEVIAPLVAGTESWAVDGTANFDEVHRALFDVLRSRQPVDFLSSIDLTGRSELACDVTLRSVSRVLRHAQNGYRYFSVDIAEWRDTSLRRRSTHAAPRGLFAPELPYPHTLTATDTASSLASTYYGDAALATIILSAAGIPRWGRTTPLVKSAKLKVGQKLTIPHAGNYLVSTTGKPITLTTSVSVSGP